MILKHLVAAALLAGGAVPAIAQSVNAGIIAWQHGNYANAVAIWRPLAEKGDADAQFNLGQAYRLGRGVATNLALAKSWLEKAASRGHVDAETTLGLLLFQNGDQGQALKWLKQAAEQDEPRAMLVYGTALFNGDSVTQDPVKGYAYVYRANAQGLPAAREIVGQLNKLMNPADRRKALAMVENHDRAAAKSLFAQTRPDKIVPKQPKPPKAAKAARVAVAEAKQPPLPPTAADVSPPKAALPKPPAVKPSPATGSWRIQLGAFAQRGAAEALYRKLSGNGALAGRSAFYSSVGSITRLQVGPFPSRSAAQAACSALHGQACFPAAAR
ncbi:MAG: SPOR domain-containing protein [Sphingomicrobium sp.]